MGPVEQRRLPLIVVVMLVLLSATADAVPGRSPTFTVIRVDAAITPPVAQYILQSLEEATRTRSDGLVIRLDTPGGLDLAMRDIVKGILGADIPVIVYVSPAGARAASAGMMITVAAHVAAMTPGTNIGAAHPVGIGLGGGMDKIMQAKVENDAVAYIRGIAKGRGRNPDWVERAVRKSASVSAEEALKLGVIDEVAPDLAHLLARIDGKVVTLASGKRVLKTRGAVTVEKKMGVRQGILTVLADPNIAYILLLIGLAGLYFEFSHPGAILPGVMGGISLILAFFALQTLPVNYAGVLLILFGITLFIAEVKVMSHGILTVGGIVSLVMGSLILFDSPEPALRVSFQVMIPTLIVICLFFVAVISLVVKAHRGRRFTGMEGMLGLEGKAVNAVGPDAGTVLVKGEYWRARSDEPIAPGLKIRVIRVDGLRLLVGEIHPGEP
ncbi:MAG: nodulation protein NfeD [Syntrophales bacterium]|nr:nodulation protein NfeD [Syntrophales bacterium]MDD4338329.1 nodulation protein NfeD [Syntrophales bacterium]